ncbi:hypothetical protein [Brevibacillus choshinensis]|uniref:Uncharacterized protein n=1 Tax=Brevibacillus choshinensis TaxID=54911 RepID=A0ABX7FGG9_BRECH|nr:hypothetical protein [Brevibacillus choshinensis]QRG65281.1 hypothetical protein JNE38_16715 [Brevibacillus choshinensis]
MTLNHEWNQRLLNVLERTYTYDAAMTDLLIPEIAKGITTSNEQNENYRARMLHFKADLKEETL